jgi:peroxiredoxin
VELQKKHEAEGLQVIGLNVGGPDDPPKAPAFAKEFGIQYPLAMPDDDLVMFLMADNNAIPQTFVFDREGKLAQRLIGFAPGDDKIIDQAVEAALQIPAQ